MVYNSKEDAERLITKNYYSSVYARVTMESHYNTCMEYATPYRQSIYNRYAEMLPPPNKNSAVVSTDSTATVGVMSFASKLMSSLFPLDSDFISVDPDRLLVASPEGGRGVKSKPDIISRYKEEALRIFESSNVRPALSEMFVDIAIGTGAMICTENQVIIDGEIGIDRRKPLTFRSASLADIYIHSYGISGSPDEIYIKQVTTLAGAYTQFNVPSPYIITEGLKELKRMIDKEEGGLPVRNCEVVEGFYCYYTTEKVTEFAKDPAGNDVYTEVDKQVVKYVRNVFISTQPIIGYSTDDLKPSKKGKSSKANWTQTKQPYNDKSFIHIYEQELNYCPVIVGRWAVIPSNPYGQGVVSQSLQDIIYVGEMKRSKITGAMFSASPPVAVRSDVYAALGDGDDKALYPSLVVPYNDLDSANSVNSPVMQPLAIQGNQQLLLLEYESAIASIKESMHITPEIGANAAVRTASELDNRRRDTVENMLGGYTRMVKEVAEPVLAILDRVLIDNNLLELDNKVKIEVKFIGAYDRDKREAEKSNLIQALDIMSRLQMPLDYNKVAKEIAEKFNLSTDIYDDSQQSSEF